MHMVRCFQKIDARKFFIYMITYNKLARYRSETPGSKNRLHLNNAGAALMPESVSEIMIRHLQLESEIGGYEAFAEIAGRVSGFYEAVGSLINAKPTEIAFLTSATDAYVRALSSIPFRTGDTILTTRDDYVSNQIAFLQLSKRYGVRIIRAQNNRHGEVDLQSVRELMARYRPRLVAVTHVPMSSGLVQPVAAIGRLCREADSIYLVDGCQSAGQLAVDVQQIGCDFFSATMRKFLRGPRGAGFLYVSQRILDRQHAPLFLDLHSATWTDTDAYVMAPSAKRYELWERSYAALLGSAAAVRYALDVGPSNIEMRVKYLAALLREKLRAIPGVTVADRGREKAGIVGVHVTGWSAPDFKNRLSQRKINTSYIAIESALLDFRSKQVDWLSRLSPHYYNTRDEIELAAAEIREITGA